MYFLHSVRLDSTGGSNVGEWLDVWILHALVYVSIQLSVINV